MELYICTNNRYDVKNIKNDVFHFLYVCFLCRIWKDMSLNDSLSELERSKLAVWDYPVSDKYTKVQRVFND
jgi:hypothetical protein